IADSVTTVTLTSPLDNWYVNNTVKFECFAASQIPLINVSLWHNNTGNELAWNKTVTTTANSAIAHFAVTGLSTSNFTWTCQACTQEGCTFAYPNRTLIVDVTAPLIDFVDPTRASGTKLATSMNNIYVNVSITEASNNYSAFIDWNRSLVGWWRLEEGNGTFFVDSSTWGNNGTCAAGQCPNLTTGMRGKAYRFDGGNDVIKFPSTQQTIPDGSQFTLMAWMYKKSNSVNTAVIYGMNHATSQSYWAYAIVDYNGVSARISNSSTSVDDACDSISFNTWTHITAVFNGTTILCYVNGLAGTTPASVSSLSGTVPKKRESSIETIGTGYAGGAGFFNGSIDEVMVWNRALSAQEINASYSAGVWKLYRNFTSLSSGSYTYKAYVVDQAGNLNNTEERTFIVNRPPTHDYPTINTTYGTNLTTENITAFNVSTADADNDAVTNIWNWHRNGTPLMWLNMPFEGGSLNGSSSGTSNAAKDYSGNSRHGTAVNVTWRSDGGVDGKGAYYFNRSIPSPAVYITPGANYSFWNKTITAWIKRDSWGHWSGIFASCTSTGYFAINAANQLIASWNNGAGTQQTHAAFTIADTNWHFVGFSLAGNGEAVTAKLYLDGSVSTSTPNNGASSTAPIQKYIGSFNSDCAVGGTVFNGTIDNVIIWNRTLSDEQVYAIYANQTNRIVKQETSYGETWSACLTPNDGYDDGATMCTRANITINTPPTKVTLAEPTHGNVTMTNRSVSFRWINASDVDGDSISYNLSIRCYKNGASCSPSDDREYNTTATSYNLTEATELRYLSDDNYYYNWTVTAYDGYQYGEASNQSNFSIMGEVIISLINDSVVFAGERTPGTSDNTTDFTPYPMRIENKGNVLTTVNLSSATRLFWGTGSALPSSFYRIRVNDTSGYENAFNETGSQTTWANVPAVNHTLFNMLNYSTNNDRGDIHIHVEIPTDEPAGAKSSILTLTGWSVS
ncbi:MAG: LamG domain-containing protein, partial [Nanoarchaeota archaeon]|nr:LamG domain-containing protein [Nanoarchaeota archaeon]